MFPNEPGTRVAKAIGILFLVLLLPCQLRAQGTGSIKGRVLERETGDVLVGANVVVQGTAIGASTDLEGRFFLRGVATGRQILKVSYIGYVAITQEVTVDENATSEREFRLAAQAITGETVVVTAQARGQNSAINQQLASNTIANIVAADRIKELPDVNAAESIGRLPGVSISRSGGEATQISIRGLSPKYNTVTLNGVQVPATGGDDRSVDLSMISSSMLDGIQLKKAITPDMDADFLGGTVDLRLKEAGEELEVNANLQGGYNKLQNWYGNYNFSGSASGRVLDGDLGIVATANTDGYDRSADKFSGNYMETGIGGVTGIAVTSILLREEGVKRHRTGASLAFDYRIPYGKVNASGFGNILDTKSLFRINRMNVNDNRHYYDVEDRHGTTKLYTLATGIKQDFDWIQYDLGLSRTGSESENPEDRTWTFVQENAAFAGIPTGARAPDIPQYATVDTNLTGLSSLYVYAIQRHERQSAVQLNVQVPVTLGDLVSGFFKAGGKYRALSRDNREDQSGRDGLQYGSTSGVSQPLSVLLRNASNAYPNDFNYPNDSTIVRKYGLFPVWRVRSDYSRSDFLNGKYPLGYTVDESLLNKLTDSYRGGSEWLPYAVGSVGRDYDGIEEYWAGYAMAEFNLGEWFTLLPGVRYEKDYSRYHGQRYREATINNIQAKPTDLDTLTNVRTNEFWLPMAHLTVRPLDWLKVRLAYTNTLTRPDYMQYAPITSINVYQSYIRAANALLKPARSTNYDAAVSIYENNVGLLTVSGFYKKIDDLILQTTIYYQSGITLPEGLNIPDRWLQNTSPQIDTYVNNPTAATYKGFEVEWQTHFWYLPSVLSGLVLNVNFTYIESEIDKQLYFVLQGSQIPGTRPPRYQKILVDSSRSARMPDQPSRIANVTLGYDIGGFSARLSYLYQDNRTTFISREPILDNFSGPYSRWDLTLQQKLTDNIQVFANFNNLNNRPDENFRGNTLIDPAYIEFYGFTMDIGVRLSL